MQSPGFANFREPFFCLFPAKLSLPPKMPESSARILIHWQMARFSCATPDLLLITFLSCPPIAASSSSSCLSAGSPTSSTTCWPSWRSTHPIWRTRSVQRGDDAIHRISRKIMKHLLKKHQVAERTRLLEEEKKKTDALLYSMLPM